MTEQVPSNPPDIVQRLNLALINLTEDDEYTREAGAAMGAAMHEIERLRHDLERALANHAADLTADETEPKP